MHAYEQAIQHTTTPQAPWHVIPADDKPMARYIVCQILVEQLSKLDDVKFPELDEKTASRLDEFKNLLNNE